MAPSAWVGWATSSLSSSSPALPRARQGEPAPEAQPQPLTQPGPQAPEPEPGQAQPGPAECLPRQAATKVPGWGPLAGWMGRPPVGERHWVPWPLTPLYLGMGSAACLCGIQFFLFWGVLQFLVSCRGSRFLILEVSVEIRTDSVFSFMRGSPSHPPHSRAHLFFTSFLSCGTVLRLSLPPGKGEISEG